MNVNSVEFANFLDDYIDKKIEERFKKQECVMIWVAIVTAVGTDTATVKLPSDNVNTFIVKNKSGETLSINDEVYLISPNGKLGNSWIQIKK